MSWAAPPARRAGARAGGARDYWQKREAACQLCDFLMHRARDEDAQLEAFHKSTVLRFATQPPMHFRIIPLDPAPDCSMVYGPTPPGHGLSRPRRLQVSMRDIPVFPYPRVCRGRRFNGHHYTIWNCHIAFGLVAFPGSAPSRCPQPICQLQLASSVRPFRAANRSSTARPTIFRESRHYDQTLSSDAREIPIRVSKPAFLHLPRQALTARVMRKSGCGLHRRRMRCRAFFNTALAHSQSEASGGVAVYSVPWCPNEAAISRMARLYSIPPLKRQWRLVLVRCVEQGGFQPRCRLRGLTRRASTAGRRSWLASGLWQCHHKAFPGNLTANGRSSYWRAPSQPGSHAGMPLRAEQYVVRWI
jgi:hypothetical protein